MQKTTVSILGSPARKALDAAQAVSVWGVTARGIYLALDSSQVVFLSPVAARGPLTANLEQDDFALLQRSLQTGLALDVEDGDLHCPGLVIRTGEAAVWNGRERVSLVPGALEDRQERFEKTHQLMRAERGAESFCAAFPVLVQQARQWAQPADALVDLLALLGSGPGLTPAGDDLALGFTLALNRWGDALRPGWERTGFNQALVAAAYRRTTTLSANLIECAAQGIADEPLLLALDGLVCGAPAPEACAAHLLHWGSSSGCNALLGMVLGLGIDTRFLLDVPRWNVS